MIAPCTKDSHIIGTIAAVGLIAATATAFGQSPPVPGADAPAWKQHEKGILENHVQLTFSDRFTRAGEAYFSPDDSMIIFQATEVPAEGEEESHFYAMFVADVLRDANGRITGIDNIRRISPEGTANTCGWFHPTEDGLVLFGSSVGEPSESDPPGFQRATGRYRWMFPPEMDIVTVHLDRADGTTASLKPLISDRHHYIAEASWSPDGRHILYTSLESNLGDLFVLDTKNNRTNRIVSAQGYDGGPFFSPDGKRITYRSDRHNNNLLQVFVGHLAFNSEGTIIGLEREYQLTDNEHVNWAPFWHPGGRHLVYATSEISHRQYEVFIVDADPGNLEGSTGTIKYGTRKRRVTHSEGFDGLPVFDSTGKIMMWTSQRGDGTSQVWVADFVMDLDPVPAPRGYPR
jgi:TolB protein